MARRSPTRATTRETAAPASTAANEARSTRSS
jgi:hypothetical protein